MQEVMVKTSDITWEPAANYPAGTSWKILDRGTEGEPKAVLLKLAAGFEMSAHSHIYAEHHYVISGEYDSQGERFRAGTYRVIPKHVDHGPFRSTQGAELLVIWAE
jgi:anti-sigma factor ChrR (cupin superfamily)